MEDPIKSEHSATLRGKLLSTVDAINKILVDGERRGKRAPRRNYPANRKSAKRKKGTRRAGKVLKEVPKTKEIPRVHKNYQWSPSLHALISFAREAPRVMTLAGNGTWSVTNRKGEQFGLTPARLADLLKVDREKLGL